MRESEARLNVNFFYVYTNLFQTIRRYEERFWILFFDFRFRRLFDYELISSLLRLTEVSND